MAGGSNYSAPVSPVASNGGTPASGILTPAPTGTSFLNSLGINQNTFLVILVVVALVLFMVAQ
jgi:hypothetical protein